MKFLVLLACLALASCSSTPLKAYRLEPDGPVSRSSGVSIGVGPILIADYLTRAEMPVQTAPNELEYSYDSLWAGTLEKQLGNTIGINLSRRLRTGSVYQYPWDPTYGVRYQVSLDVREFHSSVDGQVVLDAGWRIYDLQRKKILVSRSSYFTETFEGAGFQPALAAKSRAVSRLSAEIAAARR